jgi:hypothetical protein
VQKSTLVGDRKFYVQVENADIKQKNQGSEKTAAQKYILARNDKAESGVDAYGDNRQTRKRRADGQ